MNTPDDRLPPMASFSTETLMSLIEHTKSDQIWHRARAERVRRMAALAHCDTESVCARRKRDLRAAIGAGE